MFEIQKIDVDCDPKTFVKEILSVLHAREIGAGAFATAYSVGKDEIIKVFERDRGYLYFLKAISKTKKQNSFLPQINSVLRVKNGRKIVYMVSMERLKTVWQLREGSKRKTEFYDLMNFLDKSVDPGFKAIPDEIVRGVLPEELLDVIKIVSRGTKLSTIELGYDLHSGNVMVRANGEFVITDPLCDTEYLEF
jgi:hypothetical protein